MAARELKSLATPEVARLLKARTLLPVHPVNRAQQPVVASILVILCISDSGPMGQLHAHRRARNRTAQSLADFP